MQIAIASAVFSYGLWICFLAYAALHAAWQSLPVTTKLLAVPVIVVGFTVDVIFNLTLAGILFAELPREVTFSQRVSRLKRGLGWRAALATWVCESLLDPFEARGHCR